MCADISPGQHNLQSVKCLAQQVGAFKETAHEASNRGMPACRFADRLLCPAVQSCRDLPPGALNMTEQLIGRPQEPDGHWFLARHAPSGFRGTAKMRQ